MEKRGLLSKIHFNSPVILGFTFISFIILVANYLTGNTLNWILGIRYTSFLDPFMYIKLFTHIFAHQNMAHYTGNFLLILAVGPLVEEKYGSVSLAIMIAATSAIIGLIHIIFFRNVIVIGASGIVFMLILLASFTNKQEGRIPITVLLVGLLYIGNEIVTGLLSNDNISQLSHIIGGFCGAGFGFLVNKGHEHDYMQ